MKELKAIRESRQKPFIEEAAKFNQESIAAALGVTVQTYRAYEKDPSQMKLPTAVMLANYLGCKVEDFLFTNQGKLKFPKAKRREP